MTIIDNISGAKNDVQNNNRILQLISTKKSIEYRPIKNNKSYTKIKQMYFIEDTLSRYN